MLAGLMRVYREFNVYLSYPISKRDSSRFILTQSCHRVVGETSRLVLFIGDEIIDIHAVRLHGAQVSLDCNHKERRNIKSGYGCRDTIAKLNEQRAYAHIIRSFFPSSARLRFI